MRADFHGRCVIDVRGKRILAAFARKNRQCVNHFTAAPTGHRSCGAQKAPRRRENIERRQRRAARSARKAARAEERAGEEVGDAHRRRRVEPPARGVARERRARRRDRGIAQDLRQLPGVAQAEVESLAGDRVQRLRRVADVDRALGRCAPGCTRSASGCTERASPTATGRRRAAGRGGELCEELRLPAASASARARSGSRSRSGVAAARAAAARAGRRR